MFPRFPKISLNLWSLFVWLFLFVTSALFMEAYLIIHYNRWKTHYVALGHALNMQSKIFGVREAFLKWLFHPLHHSVQKSSRHTVIYQTKQRKESIIPFLKYFNAHTSSVLMTLFCSPIYIKDVSYSSEY